MSFAFPHRGGSVACMIVVVAQVQQAVDNVQRQLRVDIMTARLRLAFGDFGTNDQFSSQAASVALAEREAQYVGRLVVLQVALVELMDRGIIDKGQTDF